MMGDEWSGEEMEELNIESAFMGRKGITCTFEYTEVIALNILPGGCSDYLDSSRCG